MKYKVLILITVISALFYVNSITNDFQYDDRPYVTENPHIRYKGKIPAFFTHPEYLTSEGHKAHYRPLVAISYTLNYAISGLNPVSYHITNLLIHIGTAFLLFLTVQAILGSRLEVRGQTLKERSKKLEVRSQKSEEGFSYLLPLTSNFYIALAAALIFAVHPFNSEAVNYITARSTLMSGFFYLLAFYFWVKFREAGGGRNGGYYMTSLLTFILGLLAKETTITLPIILFLYDVYFVYPSLDRPEGPSTSSGQSLSLRGDKERWRFSSILIYLPFILIVAVPAVARLIYAGRAIPSFKRDLTTQICTMIPVLITYLKLLLLPAGLNLVHSVGIYSSPINLNVMFSTGILLLYIISAIYLYLTKGREWRLLSFFMVWFFVVLLPIIIFPLNQVMQENRGYIAGIGFSFFVGLVIWRIIANRHGLKWAFGLLAILILLYGISTSYRNRVWSDEVSLWRDTLEKSPLEPVVYNNLGALYMRNNNYDMARDVFERGVRLFPGVWNLHYNLGMIYFRGGDMQKAIDAFQKAINRKPDYAPAHYDLARALQKARRLEESKREFDVALDYATISRNKRLIRSIKEHIKGM